MSEPHLQPLAAKPIDADKVRGERLVTRGIWVGLSLLGVACVAASVAIVLQVRHIRSLTDASKELNEKHRQFCKATMWAIERDRKDFESDDPKRHQTALAQFGYSDSIYHGDMSLAMCLDAVPERSMWCWLNEDYRCLAAEARQAEDALRARYSR